MDAAVRRQILGDLGIVPWQLRASPGDDAKLPERQESEPGADMAPVPAPAGAADAAEAPRSVASSHLEGSSSPAEHIASAAEETSAETFSVLSLISGDTLMLLDGEASRRDLRLAMDVLGAASGDVAGRPLSRRFEWPPADGGIDIRAGARAARRALAAFVDKDVADHAVRRVLCTPEVAARWPGDASPVTRLEMPSLPSLGQDPAAKRDLWQRLRAGA